MGKKLGKKAKTALCPKCEFHLCLVASHKIFIWICPSLAPVCGRHYAVHTCEILCFSFAPVHHKHLLGVQMGAWIRYFVIQVGCGLEDGYVININVGVPISMVIPMCMCICV